MADAEQYVAHSEEDTRKYGREFAARLRGGMIVALHGTLGAGKTTFVKGIAEGLGVTDTITSPTFTLMNVYPIKRSAEHATPLRLVHVDTYRLAKEEELLSLGGEEYIGQPESISLIEWPEKLPSLLRDRPVIHVRLDYDSVGRKISIGEAH